MRRQNVSITYYGPCGARSSGPTEAIDEASALRRVRGAVQDLPGPPKNLPFQGSFL